MTDLECKLGMEITNKRRQAEDIIVGPHLFGIAETYHAKSVRLFMGFKIQSPHQVLNKLW